MSDDATRAPRLEVCYFGSDPTWQWNRLARVLAYTAAQHCPGWDVQIRHIVPAPLVSALRIESHVTNTQKMEHWHHLVAQAEEGDRLLLLDADMMILRPLDDLWDRDFDLAYTTKASRFPFNSGVVALRANARSRAFIAAWRDENRRMLDDRVHHQEWRKKYGGINQAALGYLLEHGQLAGLRLRELPCVEWNCEDSNWKAYDPEVTRIVHIKSGLRLAVFFRTHGFQRADVQVLKKLWQDLERAALAAAPAAPPVPPVLAAKSRPGFSLPSRK